MPVLNPWAATLYRETPASGAAVAGNPAIDGFGRIEQGSLEQSNVNVVSEITSLITACMRCLEMNSTRHPHLG